jgi:transposase
VNTHNNDSVAAAAIAAAVTRPTMRFTQVRTTEQVDLQALHRIRDQMIGSRTRLINQVRAFCLEYGIAIRQGTGVFRRDLPGALADEDNDLTPAMRRMLAELFEDIGRLDERIAEVTREIEALAARDDRARRLMTIPGIGPIVATALLAAVGDGRQFRRARDMAAWLGLVPREHSTGGKTALFGISKRGNRYVRRLLIHGARSCVLHLDRTRDRLGSWLNALQSRMHANKVAVALAAKIARMAWAIITRPGALYERRDPAVVL